MEAAVLVIVRPFFSSLVALFNKKCFLSLLNLCYYMVFISATINDIFSGKRMCFSHEEVYLRRIFSSSVLSVQLKGISIFYLNWCQCIIKWNPIFHSVHYDRVALWRYACFVSSSDSGPKRYDYIGGCWIYKHDGRTLHQLLSEEMSNAFNTSIDFTPCANSGATWWAFCITNMMMPKFY